MLEVYIKDEYIKLQQAMQLAGASGSGSEAKHQILEGLVAVNGEQELRRGRKLRNGDCFKYGGKEYRIVIK